jgi:hypothetical protein
VCPNYNSTRPILANSDSTREYNRELNFPIYAISSLNSSMNPRQPSNLAILPQGFRRREFCFNSEAKFEPAFLNLKKTTSSAQYHSVFCTSTYFIKCPPKDVGNTRVRATEAAASGKGGTVTCLSSRSKLLFPHEDFWCRDDCS